MSQSTSLTPREVSVFTRSLERNQPTDEERRIFFETMPARIDRWFQEHRAIGQQQMSASLPVTQQTDFKHPQS